MRMPSSFVGAIELKDLVRAALELKPGTRVELAPVQGEHRNLSFEITLPVCAFLKVPDRKSVV